MTFRPDRHAAALLLAVLAAGCADRPDPQPGRADATAAVPAAGLPRSLDLPDSLVLRLASGGEVWWTLARESADSAGATCVERGLEIRRGADSVAVPLLYTAEMPEAVDDTTIVATLWTGCAPGRRYFVDVRSGQPTPADREDGR